MTIVKIDFHFESTLPDNFGHKGIVTGSTIYMKNGTRVNGWFDAKTLTLVRANSLPRNPDDGRLTKYRRRNLESIPGKVLIAEFKAYAEQHFKAAREAHEANR